MHRLFPFCVSFCVCFAAHSDVWYVHLNNTSGIEDGRSWATAFDTIQPAIDAAFDDGGGEIWVAQGLYSENRTTDPPLAGINTGTLVLRQGIALYGGFTGLERRREERDHALHQTIIDGSSSRDGLPAYRVIQGADGAVLDGFVITGGVAERSAIEFGAGLYIVDVSMSVANCTFENNRAARGASALVLYRTTSMVTNCIFRNNVTGDSFYSSGAVSVGTDFEGPNAPVPTIQQCLFENNYGPHGGAISFYGSGPFPVYDCTFIGNRALRGGALEGDNALIIGCRFENNQAIFDEQLGGYGGAFSLTRSTIDRCTFTNNFAARLGGAGIAIQSEVSNCRFESNSAMDNGGALSITGISTTLTNCVFWRNTAGYTGGAVDMTGGRVYFEGRYRLQAAANIVHCTFYDNHAGERAGGVYSKDSPLGVYNSILFNNLPDDFVAEGEYQQTFVSHSLLSGYQDGEHVCGGDPNFINADAGNFRLTTDSSAIDQGVLLLPRPNYPYVQYELPTPFDRLGIDTELPTTDIDNAPRLVGLAPDWGAYESSQGDSNYPASFLRPVDSLANKGQILLTIGTTPSRLANRNDRVNLYYRHNGHAWTFWKGVSSDTTLSVFGADRTANDGYYEFYSVATDERGSVEMIATQAKASATVVSAYAGDRVYVSDGGSGNRTGRDWSNAAASVSDAITIAHEYGISDVWVKAGIYFERLVVTSRLNLYGGFQGWEANLEERPLPLDHSIIDAGYAGPLRPASNTLVVDQDFRMPFGEVTADGFTFTGAGRNSLRYDPFLGDVSGCIYTHQGGPLRLTNCRVVANQNSDGFGIQSCEEISRSVVKGHNSFGVIAELASDTVIANNGEYGADVDTMTDCSVAANGASGVKYGKIIEDSFIVGNTNASSHGGGVSHTGFIRNSVVAFNVADGPPYGNGGGIGRAESIENCLFVSNAAAFQGGALWLQDDASIVNSTFVNNYVLPGGQGAGLYSIGDLVVQNCAFTNQSGSALHIPDLSDLLFLSHSSFFGNVPDDITTSSSMYSGAQQLNQLPQISNVLDADPFYADSTANDLVPSPNSPLVDSGSATLAPPDDVTGRPRGFPEIGAYALRAFTTPRILAITAGAGGTTNPPPGRFTVTEHSRIPIIAVPDEGWRFLRWDGDIDPDLRDVVANVLVMDSPKSLVAIFELDRPKVIFVPTARGNGTVVHSSDRSDPLKGETIIVEAKPGDGWYFSRWEGDTDGLMTTANPLRLITDRTRELTAVFEAFQSLTISLDGPGSTHIMPFGITSGSMAFRGEHTVSINAEPEPGAIFIGWQGDVNGNQNPLNLHLTSNTAITAIFESVNSGEVISGCSASTDSVRWQSLFGDLLLLLPLGLCMFGANKTKGSPTSPGN